MAFAAAARRQKARKNYESQHQHGAYNRTYQKCFRAHAHQVFALYYDQYLFHLSTPLSTVLLSAAGFPVTISMKISLSDGSTSSKRLTLAPASIARFNISCASVPSRSSISL